MQGPLFKIDWEFWRGHSRGLNQVQSTVYKKPVGVPGHMITKLDLNSSKSFGLLHYQIARLQKWYNHTGLTLLLESFWESLDTVKLCVGPETLHKYQLALQWIADAHDLLHLFNKYYKTFPRDKD